MYGKLLAYLRDHRTRQDFYNFSEDSAALTSRDLTVFGYCVARGMEYLASKKVRQSYHFTVLLFMLLELYFFLYWFCRTGIVFIYRRLFNATITALNKS